LSMDWTSSLILNPPGVFHALVLVSLILLVESPGVFHEVDQAPPTLLILADPPGVSQDEVTMLTVSIGMIYQKYYLLTDRDISYYVSKYTISFFIPSRFEYKSAPLLEEEYV
jgi:hypothetical protein